MATNPFALDATQRDSVVKQAQDLASKSGKSAEEELWNYGAANGIDAAGIDTYMGFAPGTSQNWAVQNGKIAAPQGNYNPGQTAPAPAAPAPAPAPTPAAPWRPTPASPWRPPAPTPAPTSVQPLDEATKQAVIAEAQNRANRFGISKEQALYNYAVENGIDNASVDTLMGFAQGSTDAWLKQRDAGTQASAPAVQQAAPQGNYNPGQAVKAVPSVQTGIINSASNAAPNKPQPLGADQRALVVQRATDIGKSQGFSPEQALWNYARANNIDNAGIDAYMGFAPGSADAWEISNNKSKGIVGSAMSSALPTPGATQWSVSPDMTVQSQLKNVMDSNSPLMQQAKTQGLQMANDRGLLNSSIAESAAMDSMYKAALPIAAADAATYAKSASENAGNATNITNSNTSAATSIATNAANNDTSRANTAANNATTVATNAANNETSRANAKLQTDAAAALGVNEATYKQLTQGSASAAQLMTNYQNNLAALLRDTSITDSSARETAIGRLTEATRAAIHIIGATAGDKDLAAYMDQLLPAKEGELLPASIKKW